MSLWLHPVSLCRYMIDVLGVVPSEAIESEYLTEYSILYHGLIVLDI